jgi:hypothetical protein
MVELVYIYIILRLEWAPLTKWAITPVYEICGNTTRYIDCIWVTNYSLTGMYAHPRAWVKL